MICILALFLAAHIKVPEDSFQMTPQQFWHTAWGTDQRMPMVGDADGDGRADLLSLYPSGDGVIDFARTSSLGKPMGSNQALRNFGRDGLAAACGPFVRKAPAADVLGVFANGEVRVAWGMPPGTNQYQHNDVAATIPPSEIPRGPARTAVADFVNNGRMDVMVLDKEGNLLLLQNTGNASEKPSFSPRPIRTKLTGVQQFSAGPLAGDPHAQVVWLNDTGELFRAFVELKADGSADLTAPKMVLRVWPQEHMVVGHFRGEKSADILVGQQILPGGNPNARRTMFGIPPISVAKNDGPWVAADIDGNGMDDLIRFRRGPERFWGSDTFVHFSYKTGQDPGYYCSANDGLLDVWKTGKIKVPGLNLAALGCKVGHRDIVVEIERFVDVNEQNVRNNLARAAQYYAHLPIENPDGTKGIALHFIYRIPFQKSEHDKIMSRFDDLFPPHEQVGIVHSMFAENDGPLVAMVLGRNGHFNSQWQVFLHEFGHQMNLSHEGWWPAGHCPLYPSLMSYTYSYSLGDNGDAIGYSDGSFLGFTMNQQHLPKYVPFPFDKLKFLSGGPYHFHIQPSHDGKATMVDWNWDGLFEDEDCRTCTNYSHGIDLGGRYGLGRATTAPVLVVHGEHLLIAYGRDGQLRVRTWLGKNVDSEGQNWSDEAATPEADMIGDPTAASTPDGTTWVCYPTVEGAVLRSISIGSDTRPRISAAYLMQDTRGDQPTLTAFEGHLALALWHSQHVAVFVRMLEAKDGVITKLSQQPMDIDSSVPVAAVAGLSNEDGSSLWLARIQTHGEALEGRTEVVRYARSKEGSLEIAERRIVDGDYAGHRMTLLWRDEKGLLPQGRVYHFSGSAAPPGQASSQYITMNIPYPENGGWLTRRYGEPDFQSLSAPAACFFNGNLVYALRRHDKNPDANDSVEVSFYGDGATPALMGDFDDIGLIRDYGMSRSLREVTQG